MKQPNTWLCRTAINHAADAADDLDSAMLGFHLSGDTADEVREIAYRLIALAEPRKGHLDHDKAAFEITGERDAA